MKKACLLLLLTTTPALAGNFWQNLKGRDDVSIEDRRQWGGPGAAPIDLAVGLSRSAVSAKPYPYPWNPVVDWSKVKMVPAK